MERWVVGILKLVVIIGSVVVMMVVFKIFMNKVFVIKRVVVNFWLNNFKCMYYMSYVGNIVCNIYCGSCF